MNFPLNHTQCEALQATIVAKRDAAREAESWAEWDAYNAMIELFHAARLDAFRQASEKSAAKRSKALDRLRA